MPQLANNVLSGGKYGQPRRGVLTAPAIDYTASGFIPNETYQSSWQNSLTQYGSSTYTAGLADKYYAQPDNSIIMQVGKKELSLLFVLLMSISHAVGLQKIWQGQVDFKLSLVGLEFNNIDFQNAFDP